MDALSFAEVGEQLVRDLNEVVPAPRSKRWRCPAELKTRVVSYARACREQGETIEGIAFRLGLLGATLARWLRSDQEEVAAGFRSVAIVASAEDDEAARVKVYQLATLFALKRWEVVDVECTDDVMTKDERSKVWMHYSQRDRDEVLRKIEELEK